MKITESHLAGAGIGMVGVTCFDNLLVSLAFMLAASLVWAVAYTLLFVRRPD